MEIALRFLRYSEKIARADSAIAQNSTLWKSTLTAIISSLNLLCCYNVVNVVIINKILL